jgi:hypothetical protein
VEVELEVIELLVMDRLLYKEQHYLQNMELITLQLAVVEQLLQLQVVIQDQIQYLEQLHLLVVEEVVILIM